MLILFKRTSSLIRFLITHLNTFQNYSFNASRSNWPLFLVFRVNKTPVLTNFVVKRYLCDQRKRKLTSCVINRNSINIDRKSPFTQRIPAPYYTQKYDPDYR